jgi:hypothetical protein
MDNYNSPTQALPGDTLVPASMPATSAASTGTRIQRSCLTCHQRKIRCNKRLPCSNCIRADVFCCFPGPDPSGRRPHKTNIAEVVSRLARLERTITELSNGTLPDSNHARDSAHTPSSGTLTISRTQSVEDALAELLVQGGYASRYVNEVLLSRILDKVGDTISLIDLVRLLNSV